MENKEVTLLNEESINEFLNFMENQEEYLKSGLGAFHTDDHSNW